MEHYNYEEAMREDILSYFKERNITPESYDSAEALFEAIEGELWTDDSVTGNGAWGYPQADEEAAARLSANRFLLAEALREFDGDALRAITDLVYADTTIRCYLLDSVLRGVCEEMFS